MYKNGVSLRFLFLGLFLITILVESNGQIKRRYTDYSRVGNPSKMCKTLSKNKKNGRKSARHHIISRKRAAYAEGGVHHFNPYGNNPKSSARTVHVEKTDIVSSLDQKHETEDDILKENNLPEPTSEQHEKIRKNVQRHLANFDNENPLKLEPLYFVLDQDEFAFVDMDPFLIAVEYALQGKHLLIEGHTDAQGKSDYNVQLSIKRVERIRQLMLDMGVPDDHISIIGYGEEHSGTNNELDDDHQLDRRVDFTVF